jgi:hypothetical protein
MCFNPKQESLIVVSVLLEDIGRIVRCAIAISNKVGAAGFITEIVGRRPADMLVMMFVRMKSAWVDVRRRGALVVHLGHSVENSDQDSIDDSRSIKL